MRGRSGTRGAEAGRALRPKTIDLFMCRPSHQSLEGSIRQGIFLALLIRMNRTDSLEVRRSVSRSGAQPTSVSRALSGNSLLHVSDELGGPVCWVKDLTYSPPTLAAPSLPPLPVLLCWKPGHAGASGSERLTEPSYHTPWGLPDNPHSSCSLYTP